MDTTATAPWIGFETGLWQKEINVRDFFQQNYKPYDGDASFLAGATDRLIIVQPNAGLPQLVDGKPYYALTPAELTRWLREFVEVDGVKTPSKGSMISNFSSEESHEDDVGVFSLEL